MVCGYQKWIRPVVYLGCLDTYCLVLGCAVFILWWAIIMKHTHCDFPLHLFCCQSPLTGPVVSVLISIFLLYHRCNRCSVSLSGFEVLGRFSEVFSICFLELFEIRLCIAKTFHIVIRSNRIPSLDSWLVGDITW